MRSRNLLAALAFLWGGMILGISFLEAPVKFTAPSLSLEVGLDVGRQVFRAFHGVQLALTAVLLAILAAGRRTLCRRELGTAAIVAGLFLLQHLVVLPPLDARTVQIIAGAPTAPSQLHWIYIAFDAAKLLALLTLGGQLVGGAKPTDRR